MPVDAFIEQLFLGVRMGAAAYQFISEKFNLLRLRTINKRLNHLKFISGVSLEDILNILVPQVHVILTATVTL